MTAIQTQTFDGTPDGMNLALPANQIADTEARYIQDCLLHQPGLTIRRGPVTPIPSLPVFPTPVTGLVQTLDPTGANRLAVLRGDNVNGYFSTLNAFLTAYVDLPWNGAFPSAPPTNPYRIVDAKASLTGGSWVGTSSQYNSNGPVQSLALWRGANLADYTTGTITASRGSVTVTGSGTTWLVNVAPGSFLFANTDDGGTLAYIGVVKSVDSNTQLTLGVGSLYAITAKVYKTTSIRGFAPRVNVGRITAATGSTTVTGANTKFLSQAVNSGTWDLYRNSDFAWIGRVSSVPTETSIILAANAAIALNNERYVAFRRDADYSISTMAVADRKVGFLNAVYSERNWFANLGQRFELTSRVWFSDPSDPEAVDMSSFDGNFIDVGSSRGVNSPIKALCPAYNALVVFKENETFGIFGSSPTQFEVRKIEDDGTLGGMSVQPYGGGVIWAGREGIHFFDGIQADNISNPKLGDYYKNLIRSFDPTKFRLWSMMMRDHYFLFIEDALPNRPVIKGTTSSTPTKMTIVVNMNTKAFTIFTNVNIRGGIVMPADTGEETWYIINGATQGFICDAATLFDNSGNDAVIPDGLNPIGTTTVTIANPAVFTSTAHGLAVGDPVYFDTTGALPTGLSKQTPYYVIAAGLTANAFEVSTVLNGTALVTSGTQSGTHTLFRWKPGPDFYMESKKYNAGDSMRLKLFKMLAIHYLAQGDALKVDTVVGLNDIGRVAKTELPQTVFVWDNLQAQFGTWDNLAATASTWDNLISSVFKPKRIKFLKRTQNFAFRLYEKSDNVTNVRIGPFDLAFKFQRPMRV